MFVKKAIRIRKNVLLTGMVTGFELLLLPSIINSVSQPFA